jgi:hypothetical protein
MTGLRGLRLAEPNKPFRFQHSVLGEVTSGAHSQFLLFVPNTLFLWAAQGVLGMGVGGVGYYMHLGKGGLARSKFS